MKNFILSIVAFFALSFTAAAQTCLQDIVDTPEKSGGVYYAYPVTQSVNTPAPEGFKPFYISHYGRHGSRYLISDNDYSGLLGLLHSADSARVLTPLGRDVMVRLDSVWSEAQGRGGELSPLGRRQHHDIATRMYKAFPEVFQDNPRVEATSTVVMRCAHSMFAFIEALKEQDPTLDIPRESGQRNMWYLNYHSPESGPYSSSKAEWHKAYVDFRDTCIHPERLVGSLFTDPAFLAKAGTTPENVMEQLYWIAVGQQNIETPVTFLDLFTPEELYAFWQLFNYRFFATNSSYPTANGVHTANARNLVRHIVDKADRHIAEKRTGATLRFGHDGNIIPLTALLRLKDCYSDATEPVALGREYSDYRISPMASNLQMVFFSNEAGDVIVKFMLNEREIAIDMPTDTFPFYRWNAVRKYLLTL